MNTLEVLKAARERIAVPERWTQGAYARSADRWGVPAVDPRAVCWCLAGAIDVTLGLELGDAVRSVPRQIVMDQLKATLSAYGSNHIHYNDEHSHPEVLAIVDATIARLEAE